MANGIPILGNTSKCFGWGTFCVFNNKVLKVVVKQKLNFSNKIIFVINKR